MKTPAESIAEARKAEYDLSKQGIPDAHLTYWNLTTESLTEEAIFRNEGNIAGDGPLITNTGKHTGRSANDKFIVRHVDSEKNIWWGTYNRPFEEGKFDALHKKMLKFMQDRDIFVQDVYAGADENYRLPVRFITEFAWHSHFIRNMFNLPMSLEEHRRFVNSPSWRCPPSRPLLRAMAPIVRPSSCCLSRKSWSSLGTLPMPVR
jgi:phosphoenolpyruvate carboxykinase (ATP)